MNMCIVCLPRFYFEISRAIVSGFIRDRERKKMCENAYVPLKRSLVFDVCVWLKYEMFDDKEQNRAG